MSWIKTKIKSQKRENKQKIQQLKSSGTAIFNSKTSNNKLTSVTFSWLNKPRDPATSNLK